METGWNSICFKGTMSDQVQSLHIPFPCTYIPIAWLADWAHWFLPEANFIPIPIENYKMYSESEAQNWNVFLFWGKIVFQGPRIVYSYSRFLIVFLLCSPKIKSIQNPAESNVSQGWWSYPDVLHCHDGKADCHDVLYILSVGISVSHESDDCRGTASINP